MVLAVWKHLNSTKPIILNRFCFKNFAKKKIPGGVLALGLLLGVFGSGLGPDDPGCPEIP